MFVLFFGHFFFCCSYNGDIVVVMGDCWNSKGRGVESTNKSVILEVLKQHFFVVLTDEKFSSQHCHACLGQLEFLNKKVDLRRKVGKQSTFLWLVL